MAAAAPEAAADAAAAERATRAAPAATTAEAAAAAATERNKKLYARCDIAAGVKLIKELKAFKMQDITEIMDMLDWHKLPEVQAKGIALARNTETILPFIQPLTPEHNKNVWENCAVIIAEKSDEKLRPYLAELLEWVQDMNWPGAFRIMDRLQKYSDDASLCSAINTCISKAITLGLCEFYSVGSKKEIRLAADLGVIFQNLDRKKAR